MLDSKPIHIGAGKIAAAKEKVYILEKKSANAKMGFTPWELAELKKYSENGGVAILRSEKETKIVVQIDKVAKDSMAKSKEEFILIMSTNSLISLSGNNFVISSSIFLY